jgi:Ni/Co efflux regulator RcnB
MKKLVLSIAALALVATTMTSCKKDYTCECTTTALGITVSEEKTINDTKKNAEAECDKGDLNVSGITTSCSIK